MMPLWILVLSLNIRTQAVDFSRPSFLSAKPGERITLNCSFGHFNPKESLFWYKQKIGEMPQEIGKRITYKDIDISTEFKTSGFVLEVKDKNFSLIIPHIKDKDEGLYFCAKSFLDDIFLSSGTFLAVKGDGDAKVSVFQRGLWDSVRCESGSSTHTYVYNFSKNLLSLNDTGTYYCAVALCGKIIFENRTEIQMEKGPELVIYLPVVVVVCVVVIFAQTFLICKMRYWEQFRVRSQKCSATEKNSSQGHDAEELNYAALHFNKKKKNTKRMKRKGNDAEDFCVYSTVRSET
ncbi:uncharacterized protein LOC125139152 [Tachysurus fulvidraco]|uniref:uncharacterized protein LOC125139152 n=1 Tax=Tachysurus fulvidraco TaxID=1234273 RepID=UPI001FEF1E7F|nr:uncharacterized protein LOC125139152 [Tachysurus fulvidraco]